MYRRKTCCLDHEADCLGPPVSQAGSGEPRRVAQPFGGFQDLLARLFVNVRTIVERTRNRPD